MLRGDGWSDGRRAKRRLQRRNDGRQRSDLEVDRNAVPERRRNEVRGNRTRPERPRHVAENAVLRCVILVSRITLPRVTGGIVDDEDRVAVGVVAIRGV